MDQIVPPPSAPPTMMCALSRDFLKFKILCRLDGRSQKGETVSAGHSLGGLQLLPSNRLGRPRGTRPCSGTRRQFQLTRACSCLLGVLENAGAGGSRKCKNKQDTNRGCAWVSSDEIPWQDFSCLCWSPTLTSCRHRHIGQHLQCSKWRLCYDF